MAKKLLLPLTPHQVEFLWLVVQDYLQVSNDRGVLRDAKNIRRELEKLQPVFSHGERK